MIDAIRAFLFHPTGPGPTPIRFDACPDEVDHPECLACQDAAAWGFRACQKHRSEDPAPTRQVDNDGPIGKATS